jgi:hypothetical protein
VIELSPMLEQHDPDRHGEIQALSLAVRGNRNGRSTLFDDSLRQALTLGAEHQEIVRREAMVMKRDGVRIGDGRHEPRPVLIEKALRLLDARPADLLERSR